MYLFFRLYLFYFIQTLTLKNIEQIGVFILKFNSQFNITHCQEKLYVEKRIIFTNIHFCLSCSFFLYLLTPTWNYIISSLPSSEQVQEPLQLCLVDFGKNLSLFAYGFDFAFWFSIFNKNRFLFNYVWPLMICHFFSWFSKTSFFQNQYPHPNLEIIACFEYFEWFSIYSLQQIC